MNKTAFNKRHIFGGYILIPFIFKIKTLIFIKITRKNILEKEFDSFNIVEYNIFYKYCLVSTRERLNCVCI